MKKIGKKLNTLKITLVDKGVFSAILLIYSKIRYGSVNFSMISTETKKIIYNDSKFIKALTDAVCYVYATDVQGDLGEFGTNSGRSAVCLATSIKSLNLLYEGDARGNRKALFFDSFEGLPISTFDEDINSPHVISGVWGKGTCKELSYNDFTVLISKYLSPKFFSVYRGWFKDTINILSPSQKFALIHIDSDLYSSAIDVLDVLFSRKQISCGAIILFDDWNFNAASPIFGERKAWAEIVRKFSINFSDEGSYGVASHKFIIHSYAI